MLEEMTWSLAGVIAPTPLQRFLRETWGRSFLKIPGDPNRFNGLIDFAVLEDMLSRVPLEETRFRLVKNGKTIPPADYRVPRRKGTVVSSGPLARRLAEGCSIVLEFADDLSAPIGDLAAAFYRELGVRTHVNLYASWKPTPGFDLHWDDHHVLILQVEGSKSWKVFEPTIAHPLRDAGPIAPHPSRPPHLGGHAGSGRSALSAAGLVACRLRHRGA